MGGTSAEDGRKTLRKTSFASSPAAKTFLQPSYGHNSVRLGSPDLAPGRFFMKRTRGIRLLGSRRHWGPNLGILGSGGRGPMYLGKLKHTWAKPRYGRKSVRFKSPDLPPGRIFMKRTRGIGFLGSRGRWEPNLGILNWGDGGPMYAIVYRKPKYPPEIGPITLPQALKTTGR